MTTDEVIGEAAHRLLWRRGIPQRVLAEKVGVSQSVLSKKLHGRVVWTAAEVLAAADFLDVPLSELLPHECAVRDSNPEPADYVLAA